MIVPVLFEIEVPLVDPVLIVMFPEFPPEEPPLPDVMAMLDPDPENVLAHPVRFKPDESIAVIVSTVMELARSIFVLTPDVSDP